ncbi:MAG: hypothetical protein HYS13_15100 [Planctomycetia bacterium]|nr:hypothetical protein [Planctomycetia bacterium]
MKTFLGWRLVGAGVLLGWLLASTDTASAQPPGAGEPEAKVPADTCILELTIPPKTQVTVDGKAQSNTRRITWPGLQRGKIYVSKLNFRFDNGATETRTVLVEAGRQLRLAVQHPQIARPKLALQVGHSKLPYGSAFSPDGKWIATTGGYGDNTAILWDRATGRQLRRMVHRDGVDAVAFTPDSQFAIVASATGKLLIWETATGAVKHELAAGDSWIPAGSLTAKEGYIAACDRSGTTHVWDASSRTLVCRLRLYPDNTAYFCTGWGVRLRPQTSHLVAHLTARESDRTAGFMTYDEFELRRRAAKTLDEIERLNDEFDRQTKEYELRRKEWSLLVQWDIASGAKLRTFHLPGYEFGRFAISPDGQLLVASCHSPRGAGAASEAANHFLVAWRLDDGREVARNTSTDRLTSLKFSRDGQHVRAWSEDKLIRFRATDLAEIEASRLPGVGELDTGFVHPDFECLLRWGYDERDRIFRMSCRSATEPVSAWTVDFHQGHALEFLPGQDWILSQSGGAVLMVDSATQRVVRTLYRPTNDRTLRGAGFFPDPGWVLVHTEIRRPQDPEPRPGEPVEAEFLVFDPRTGEQVRQFRLSDACEASHKRRLRQLQVSSDGEWALAATHDYQAVVLETATGKVVGRFQPMYRGDRLAVSNAVFVPGTGGVLVGAIGTNFPDQDPPQPFGYLWYPDTGDWRARLSVPSELLTFTSSFMAYLPQRRLVLAIGSASRHQPGASGIHELTGHCCLWSARGPIVHSYPAAAGMLRSGKSWLNPGARFEYRIENEHFLPPVVSPDERLLVLSDGEKDETEIVSIDSGSVLRTLPGMTTSFAYHERVLAMSDGTGTSALVDVSTGAEVARIVRLGSHDDWLAVTPEGLFDGTEKARQLVAFQIGDSTDLVPVDRFFQDFYRPGLLSAVFQGSRPLPDAAFAGSLPPRVRIVAPKEGGVAEPLKRPTAGEASRDRICARTVLVSRR